MFYQNNPPWTKIHEFLLAASSQQTVQNFKSTVMNNISNLIHYDRSVDWFQMGKTSPIRLCDTIGCSEYWVQAHNNYYYQIAPPVWDPDSPSICFIDWSPHHLQNTEYYCDFVSPQGVYFGLGIVFHDNRDNPILTLTMTDSKYNYQKHQSIQHILKIIQPHLANYYSYLNLLASQGQKHLHLAELAADCKLLSKREAEIAGLLCQRLSVPEISSLLLISSKTAYRHVANIYEKLGVNNRKDLILKITGKEDLLSLEE